MRDVELGHFVFDRSSWHFQVWVLEVWMRRKAHCQRRFGRGESPCEEAKILIAAKSLEQHLFVILL